MPRARRVPKYCQHRTGQAFVKLGGKNHYLGKHGSPESLPKYHQVVGEWFANGAIRESEDASGQTLHELAQMFSAWACLNKSVKIVATGKDRYGRLLAHVTLPDGKGLNRELVKRGSALRRQLH